jgi:hypothetical protein
MKPFGKVAAIDMLEVDADRTYHLDAPVQIPLSRGHARDADERRLVAATWPGLRDG